jgi:hypothetical protein
MSIEIENNHIRYSNEIGTNAISFDLEDVGLNVVTLFRAYVDNGEKWDLFLELVRMDIADQNIYYEDITKLLLNDTSLGILLNETSLGINTEGVEAVSIHDLIEINYTNLVLEELYTFMSENVDEMASQYK